MVVTSVTVIFMPVNVGILGLGLMHFVLVPWEILNTYGNGNAQE